MEAQSGSSGPQVFTDIIQQTAGIHVVWNADSDILYHYTSADGLVGILRQHVLWASDSRCLNDTLEFRLGLSIALDTLGRHRGFQPLRNWVEGVIDTWSRDAGLFVVCFSRDGDLLSQWRAYGRDGQGYCLGFDMRNVMTHVEGFHRLRLEGSIGWGPR